jgi:hypothetical protein
VHLVEHDPSSSDDESTDIYTTKLVWLAKAKPSACSSLQPIQKNRQEEVKFTFNVAKCDKIFEELLKSGNIKLTHTIPPLDELKRCAYCKCHNSFSHATNDCNVSRRQRQSDIHEGRLSFQKMQIDKHQFSDNIILPTDKKVLVPPEVSDKDKRKNIIIGDPHTPNISQGVVTQKALDKGIIKTGGATSKYGRTTDQRSLSCASRTVRHLRSDSPEPARTVWRTQPDVSAAARGHNIHTH